MYHCRGLGHTLRNHVIQALTTEVRERVRKYTPYNLSNRSVVSLVNLHSRSCEDLVISVVFIKTFIIHLETSLGYFLLRPENSRKRTRKINRREANIDKIFASIYHVSCSYKSSGVVDELDLSKVQAVTLRQVKWIKYMLESETRLTENIRRTFLQNLKPAVKRAVAEATENEDASSSEDGEQQGKQQTGREWEG